MSSDFAQILVVHKVFVRSLIFSQKFTKLSQITKAEMASDYTTLQHCYLISKIFRGTSSDPLMWQQFSPCASLEAFTSDLQCEFKKFCASLENWFDKDCWYDPNADQSGVDYSVLCSEFVHFQADLVRMNYLLNHWHH